MIRWLGNIFLAALLALVVLFAIVTAQFGVSGMENIIVMLVVLMVLLLLIWGLSIARSEVTTRRRQAAIAVAYLDQTVRMNLPLGAMLASAQASESGATARAIGRLRSQLNAGETIAGALRQALPGVSRRTLALLHNSERTGQIGKELERAVDEQNDRQFNSIEERSFLTSYPIAMVTVIIFVCCWMMILVMPRFEIIFRDFRIPLPALTRATIDLAGVLGSPLGVGIFLAVATTLVLLHLLSPLLRRWKWFAWQPRGWFGRSGNLADICRVMAESLDSGLPLHTALRQASDLWIGQSLRLKLFRWANGVEAGMAASDAATAAGIPKLVAGLTGTAEVAAAAEAFRFLSRYYDARFSRLRTVLRAAAIPVMVFFFGTIVAIVALSLFLPLIALIDAVGPYRGSL